MRRILAFFSSFCKCVDRILAVFPEFWGVDKVQAGLVLFGVIFVVSGFFLDHSATSPTEASNPRQINHYYFYFGTNLASLADTNYTDRKVSSEAGLPPRSGTSTFRKIFSLVCFSLGTSFLASGLILRITRRKDNLQESVGKAGVIFVGDREAFDEVIGWDKWIMETRRCANLVIIGKDQIKWAEQSAEAISAVLKRGIEVSFIFQGDGCNESLKKFWEELKHKDPDGSFGGWIREGKLRLLTNMGNDGKYGYYWNGSKLVVKLYFEVERKIQAPLIVFDVRFAAGKFDHADFSAGAREHVPNWEKKRMLLQAGLNISKIQSGAVAVTPEI